MTLVRPELIRRGARFSGRILRDALRIVARAPLGGRNIVATSSAQRVTVRLTGHQIIPKGDNRFPVRLLANTPIEGEVNRWDYDWEEVVFDKAGGIYLHLPGTRVGGVSDDPSTAARNRVENQNDGLGQEGYGVDITGLGQAQVTILAIIDNSITLLSLEKDTQGNVTRWFSASNDVQVVCN